MLRRGRLDVVYKFDDRSFYLYLEDLLETGASSDRYLSLRKATCCISSL